MNKILDFLRDNKFVHFAIRFIVILSIILYAQYNPALVYNYVVPALFIVFSLIEIIFAKKLQAWRDRKRVANGKRVETAVDVRRYAGISGVLFGLLILCYVFIL